MSGRLASVVATALVGCAVLMASLAAATEPATRSGVPVVTALVISGNGQVMIKAEPRALYESRNGGRAWRPIVLPKRIERGTITAIAIAAKSTEVLYLAGRGFGVWRSTDAGRHWAPRNIGLPSTDVATLASHADQPGTVYAYVSGRGIFRSEDAGSHWRLMDAGPRGRIFDLVHSNMAGSMQTGWLFAATAAGVERSMDCFCGWRNAGGLTEPIAAVAYDPSDPRRIYAASSSRMLMSEDGGEHWSGIDVPDPPAALAVDRNGVVYAARRESLVRSSDRGRTWSSVDE